MTYPRFVFDCAKEAANYGDASMTYESFLMQEMDLSDDYSGFLDKAFTACNQFLQRVSALGFVPMKLQEFEPSDNLTLPEDCLTPKYVFQYRDDDNHARGYESLSFRKNGRELLVTSPFSPYRKVYVQYKPKIPFLCRSDIYFVEKVSDVNGIELYLAHGETFNVATDAIEAAEANQFDLETLGISDELLSVGIDWVKGRLNEDESKGHSQEMEAESRLSGMEPDQYEYAQTGTRPPRL